MSQSQPTAILQRIYRQLNTSLRLAVNLVKQNIRPLLWLEAGYWSLTLAAGAFAMYRPGLQLASRDRTTAQLDAYALGRTVEAAYKDGRVLAAALWTCGINLSVGAFGTITLPSWLFPLSGAALQAYRMIEWGLLFAPVEPDDFSWPHTITMLIEGQAFILAALGDYLLTRQLIRWYRTPQPETSRDSATKDSFWSRYRRGVLDSIRLYPLITATLAVSALWEAYEVIHLPRGWAGR